MASSIDPRLVRRLRAERRCDATDAPSGISIGVFAGPPIDHETAKRACAARVRVCGSIEQP